MNEETGIEEARKNLGDLANRAHYAGQVTYITRRGVRIAAITPIDRVAKEPITPNATYYMVARPDDVDRSALPYFGPDFFGIAHSLDEDKLPQGPVTTPGNDWARARDNGSTSFTETILPLDAPPPGAVPQGVEVYAVLVELPATELDDIRAEMALDPDNPHRA